MCMLCIRLIYMCIYVDKGLLVKHYSAFITVVCNYMHIYFIFRWTTVWISAQNGWCIVIFHILLVQCFAHTSIAVYSWNLNLSGVVFFLIFFFSFLQFLVLFSFQFLSRVQEAASAILCWHRTTSGLACELSGTG